jgi:GGDEF domain-containing protein
VLLNDLDTVRSSAETKALSVADKIRKQLARTYQLPLRHHTDQESILNYHCSSSLGLVLFQGDKNSGEDLLRWADIAMYQAKNAGKNQVVKFPHESCSKRSDERLH